MFTYYNSHIKKESNNYKLFNIPELVQISVLRKFSGKSLFKKKPKLFSSLLYLGILNEQRLCYLNFVW